MITAEPRDKIKRFDDARYRPNTPADAERGAAIIRLPEESNDGYRALRDVVQQQSAWIKPLQEEISRVIVGQKHLVDRLLIALLTNGHVLLEGVPGLAKTLSLKTLANCVELDFKRLQFTPDMLPADIVGTMIYSPTNGDFHTKHGPIFSNLILADEINRAPAKVQSALLEAMQEHQVTIGEETYQLPNPFLVLATQNPLEQEGTYPLPEAQLDRFLLQIDVDYPDADAERRMLIATTFGDEAEPLCVCGPGELIDAQQIVRRLPVGEKVVDAILRLVRAARPDGDGTGEFRSAIAWGPGPRASQAFMLAVRARALLDGRFAPSTDDVVALAHPVLRHRMALNFSARAEGTTIADIIERLCRSHL
jgi:MoxR-like ATPase